MELTVPGLDMNDTLQRTKIASFCPWVEIVDDSFAIDSDIKDAKTLVVFLFATALTMPGLYKVEFYAILCER